MVQLILLLLGVRPLRASWWMFMLLSIMTLALGGILVHHTFDHLIFFVLDLLGFAFVIYGVARILLLASIGFPNALVSVLKALGLVAFGILVIDSPWDENIVATIVFGAVLLTDGAFRLIAALVIRSFRWRRAAAIGVIEVLVATLIWAPWPIPSRHTVPFCAGLALLATSWALLRLGLQLRRLPPGASVMQLPIFAEWNWHGRGVLPSELTEPAAWENEDGLIVHVWTPVGSSVNPQRRLVIDRYIAAVDQNGVIATGHAALSLPPDIYVSLCPVNDIDHSPAEFGRILRAGIENDVPGTFRPSLEEECAGWRRPDREVVFNRYNAAGLRAFIETYRQRRVYNLTSRNCSTSVALCLDVAIEGVLSRAGPLRTIGLLLIDPAMWMLALWRARAEAMTWTPGLVLDYAQALKQVVDGRHGKWVSRLSTAQQQFATGRRLQNAEAQPTKSNLPAIAVLVGAGMIFGLTYGLSAPLIALSLTQMGFGKGIIGANAAMHALGVLIMAPILPGLAWRTGPKLPVAGALLAVALILAMFPMMPSIWLWFPLRIALGAASETILVLTETWINQLADDGSRTRTIAIYTAALSVGFALGPVLLTVVGTEGELPFLLGSAIALTTLLFLAMPFVQTPAFERPTHGNPLRYLRLAPIAIAATLVNAALETAGMSFLPLYAMRLGWTEDSATMLLSVLLLGAIIMQLPIGWLGDRTNGRRLVIGLGIASALGALAWPLAIHTPFLAYPLLFVWGGLFVGIYTVSMAVVGNRFKGGDLVSIYAVMSLAWGVGGFIGPSAAGAAMDLGGHGLPLFAAIVCALFTVLAISRRSGA